jgi:hypothetical protein
MTLNKGGKQPVPCTQCGKDLPLDMICLEDRGGRRVALIQAEVLECPQCHHVMGGLAGYVQPRPHWLFTPFDDRGH